MDSIHSILSCQRRLASRQQLDMPRTLGIQRSNNNAILWEQWTLRVLRVSLILLASAEVHATGVCLVCPPGFDCATGSPVGKTGSAALATMGDIKWSNVVDKPIIPTASTAAPTTLGTTATPGATSTTTYSKSDHAHGYDHTKLYGVYGLCSDRCANSGGKLTDDWLACSRNKSTLYIGHEPNIQSATEGNAQYCWCYKYKLDGSGHSPRPVYLLFFTYPTWCRSNCQLECMSQSEWREVDAWAERVPDPSGK